MSIPSSANFIPQDDTVLLDVQSSDVSTRNKQQINENSEQHKAQYFEDVFMDHDYFMQNNWSFTEYTAEEITYIAGFVVRTVIKRINCLCCKQLLISGETQRKLDIYCTDNCYSEKIEVVCVKHHVMLL